MAESSDPRHTEERLRNHLDNNQPMRERMCLALLPLLGPFTREQPRRPRGGPDGARDIEALYEGNSVVWGAVGFRNGGGADAASRKAAEKKFKLDLDAALAENPQLPGFVFFTNVDLTPAQKDELKHHAYGGNVKIAEIYDFEILRHTLDSPEGLIARLQYLDIPMTPTEQLRLVGKFGNELQNAVTSRFDRVEQTLSRMEGFLDLQKPIFRLDVYVGLVTPLTSKQIGEGAICITIEGLQDLSKSVTLFCVNCPEHEHAGAASVLQAHLWISDQPDKLLSFGPSLAAAPNLMCTYTELSLTAGGRRVALADATAVHFTACCTRGLYPSVKAFAIDANGYELLSATPNAPDPTPPPKCPRDLTFPLNLHEWVVLLSRRERITLFQPYARSPRFLPLTRIRRPGTPSAGPSVQDVPGG